jgi:uncharacterized protein YecT (DUF1311 family)
MCRLAPGWPATVILAALVIEGATHPCRLSAQTQLEINDAAQKEYAAADAALGRVYTQILTEYRDDAVFVRKLREAERAWLRFRDAQVESLYPQADKRRAYGTVYPLCRLQALTALTIERTKQLNAWLDGVEETDPCAGSRRARGAPAASSAAPSTP